MSWEGSGVGEDDAEGHVSDASPMFSVYEVRESTEEDAEGREDGDDVGESEEGNIIFLCVPPSEEEESDGGSVEGHSAFPDGEDFEGVAEVEEGVIEEHEA